MGINKKHSLIVAGLLGALAAPAVADAHTTQGNASCALSAGVPTITAQTVASSFSGSGNGGTPAGTNTVHRRVVIDGVKFDGTFTFSGTGVTDTFTQASTAGAHTVQVFTLWSSSETRDGHSQAQTSVFGPATVTCPAAPTPPTPPTPPAPPAPPAPPVYTPPVAPPVDVPPVVEQPPVVVAPPVVSVPPRIDIVKPTVKPKRKHNPGAGLGRKVGQHAKPKKHRGASCLIHGHKRFGKVCLRIPVQGRG